MYMYMYNLTAGDGMHVRVHVQSDGMHVHVGRNLRCRINCREALSVISVPTGILNRLLVHHEEEKPW